MLGSCPFPCLRDIAGDMALLKVLWFLAIFALLYRESEAGIFCTSNSDCSASNVCCQSECLPSCVDHSCIFNSDCGDVSVDTYCCNSDTCQLTCVGHACNFDMDCGGPNEYCCDDKCQVGRCDLPWWAIALIVFAAFFMLIAGATLCCCRTIRRQRTPGLIVAVPVAVAGSNVNYGAVSHCH